MQNRTRTFKLNIANLRRNWLIRCLIRSSWYSLITNLLRATATIICERCWSLASWTSFWIRRRRCVAWKEYSLSTSRLKRSRILKRMTLQMSYILMRRATTKLLWSSMMMMRHCRIRIVPGLLFKAKVSGRVLERIERLTSKYKRKAPFSKTRIKWSSRGLSKIKTRCKWRRWAWVIWNRLGMIVLEWIRNQDRKPDMSRLMSIVNDLVMKLNFLRKMRRQLEMNWKTLTLVRMETILEALQWFLWATSHPLVLSRPISTLIAPLRSNPKLLI